MKNGCECRTEDLRAVSFCASGAIHHVSPLLGSARFDAQEALARALPPYRRGRRRQVFGVVAMNDLCTTKRPVLRLYDRAIASLSKARR